MTAANQSSEPTQGRKGDRISIGLLLPHGSRGELSRIPGRAYEGITRVAVEAEKLRFTSIWLSDHLISPVRPEYAAFESWTTLAALAAKTRTIRLGTMVTCNSYRHPPLLAKMAATVDNLSDGRLEFGIGAGWYKREHDAYGFPYPPLTQRTAMLRESVKLIKRLWTEDKISFDGKYYQTREAVSEPKPVQKPYPPVWIGGKSRSVLKVAAEHADGCNFPARVEDYRQKLNILRSYCGQFGSDLSRIRPSLYGLVVVGENEAEARLRLRAYLSLSRIPLWGRVRTALPQPKIVLSFLKDRIIRRRLPAGWIIGTPEQCTQTLQEYTDIGVRDFMLYIAGAAQGEALELFAQQVIPALTGT